MTIEQMLSRLQVMAATNKPKPIKKTTVHRKTV